jgi:endonuclease/exonuclease/phosphatase family metal-dependent hydrolase
MRLLTWNLNGLTSDFLDERTEAAVFLAATGQTLSQLSRSKGKSAHAAPDVMLFQEVVDKTFHAHLKPHLEHGGYHLFPSEPPGRAQFEVVAVRSPAVIATAETMPLERSLYGRMLTVVTITGIAGAAPGDPVKVLTSHFDSGTSEKKVRLAELHQVNEVMDERTVFGGDTNLRAAEWTEVREKVGFEDVWEALGKPDDSKATWHAEERSARFDRIWVGAQLTPTKLTLVGDKPIGGYGVMPSDHIGLIVDVRIG